MESYVHDIFGGAKSKALAAKLLSELIAVGRLTTAIMNPLKSKGPTQILAVLGLRYNALTRRVNLPPTKQEKYLKMLRETRSALLVKSKNLEKLLGYLCFSSWVEPFGRPLLSALTRHVSHDTPHRLVCFDNFAICALDI